MRGLLYGTALICVLGLTAGSVSAASSRNGPNADSTEVSVEGVDLSDARQVEVFYAQLKKAANRVCAVRVENDAEAKSETRACEQKALDWAIQDINQRALTARHAMGQANSYAEAKPQS